MRSAHLLLLVLALATTACGGSDGADTTAGQGSWFIVGTVQGTDDVEGVTVLLTGDRTLSTTTNASGAFQFAGVPNGAYRVRPQAGGYDFTPNFYDIYIAGQQPSSVTFTMGPLTDPDAPTQTVRLVLVHHDTGTDWLDRTNGNLGENLGAQNYYVRDVSYGWDAPENPNIGDSTDIGQYWTWFADTTVQPNGKARRQNITEALYTTDSKTADYPSDLLDPGGENTVILFMSSYENCAVKTDNGTFPAALRGQPYTSPAHTLTNCKAMYEDMLAYFRTRPDKLFVVVTAPPLASAVTSPADAANARALHDWLVFEWLQDLGWTNRNVYVWDMFNVLTDEDNHHRYELGQVVHDQVGLSNTAAYPTSPVDSLPDGDGNYKSTTEILGVLNVFYNRWDHWRSTP